MFSKQYYLAKAEQYSQAAAAASTDESAATLRALAANYLELAHTAGKSCGDSEQGTLLDET